jgi:hypothetical protein
MAIDLEKECMKILSEYQKDVKEEMDEAIKKVAKAGAKKVRENSGVFGGTGKYANGWTSKVENGRLSAKGTIYNAKVPGLPHLLENGHAKRGGGRVPGRVHIAPVEKELEELFTREFKP